MTGCRRRPNASRYCRSSGAQQTNPHTNPHSNPHMCRSLCPTDDVRSRRACQFRRHRSTCRGEGIAHNCVFGSTVTGPEHVRPDIACFDLHLRRDERDLNPHGRAANDRPARATQAGCCRPTQCRPEPHAVDRTVWIIIDVLDDPDGTITVLWPSDYGPGSREPSSRAGVSLHGSDRGSLHRKSPKVDGGSPSVGVLSVSTVRGVGTRVAVFGILRLAPTCLRRKETRPWHPYTPNSPLSRLRMC
jgi:hypothetical protein